MKKFITIIIIFLSSCSQYSESITEIYDQTTIKQFTLPPKWTETSKSPIFSNTPSNSVVIVPTQNNIYTSTMGPTPTIIPEEYCPNFSLDQLPSDFSTLTDPSGLIGKHFDPSIRNKFQKLATELDNLTHYLVISKIDTGILIWIERLICWDAYGIPYFKVNDAIIMNTLSSDQSISIDCWSEEQPIYYALAVGSVNLMKEPVEFGENYGWLFDRLDYGYFIDTNQERIIPISITGWTCMRPYGPCGDC